MTDEEMRAPLTPGSARVWANNFEQLAEAAASTAAIEPDVRFALSVDYYNFRLVYVQGSYELAMRGLAEAFATIGKFLATLNSVNHDPYVRVELRHAGNFAGIR